MRQLDLFAGIGGISLAAEWAGIETVAFCEKEPFAQNVLRRRFPNKPIYDDVFNLTKEVLKNDGITGIDIIAGGFPCQPFSNAGKRTGTADDRYLWPEMCRIVDELRPTWVFAENVDGLVSMAQSDSELVLEDETTICEEAEMVVETIRQDLEAIGYQSVPIVIPACGVGASHRRYRIFILGYSQFSGRNGDKRRRANEESTDRYEALADTESERCGEARRGCKRPKERAAWGGAVAYAAGAGLSQRRRSEWTESDKEKGTGLDSGVERCGQDVADTESRRWETRGTEQPGQQRELRAIGSRASCENVADTSSGRRPRPRESIEPCNTATDRTGETSEPLNVRIGEKRTAQSGMGRSPYELSDWMDGWGMNPLDALINFISSYPQPALMGQEQHEWEPSRVATGVKNRAARLKALGNAVDPLQALPVLYGIRVINDYLKGAGCFE